jgi:hypothetical protein
MNMQYHAKRTALASLRELQSQTGEELSALLPSVLAIIEGKFIRQVSNLILE